MEWNAATLHQACPKWLKRTPWLIWSLPWMLLVALGAWWASGSFSPSWTTTSRWVPVGSENVWTPAQIQGIEIALAARGLNESRWEQKKLLVPVEKRQAYAQVLADSKPWLGNLGEATSQSHANNPFESLSAARERQRRAKQQDIARGLCELPFVSMAWVCHDEQATGSLKAGNDQSASVWIRPEEKTNLSAEMKLAIARQVQASFAGLPLEAISILDLSNGELFLASQSNPPRLQLEERMKTQERELREKAERLMAPLTQAYGPIRVELTVAADDTPFTDDALEDQSPEAVRPAKQTIDLPNRTVAETRNAQEPLSKSLQPLASSDSFRYAFVVSLPELPARVPAVEGSSMSSPTPGESIANPLHAKVRSLLMGLFDEASTQPSNIQITLVEYPPVPASPLDLVAGATPTRRANRPWEDSIPLWLAIAVAAAGSGWMIRHWLAPSNIQRLPSIPRPLVEDTSAVSAVPADSPTVSRRIDGRFEEDAKESPNLSLLDWASQNPQLAASSMEEWLRRAA